MTKEEQNSLFDWSLYGALVKNARRKMGYKTAEAFSATIWRRTRYHISKDTLYKIEQGKQMPDAAQFMAISLVLEKSFYPASIGGICASIEWQGIANGEGIPSVWKRENLAEACNEEDEEFKLTEHAAALRTGEPYEEAEAIFERNIPF